MKGAFSKVLIVLGIILILLAILWWAIAVGVLVKFPTDLDVTAKYEGTLKLCINPQTKQPLETPIEFPVKVERNVKALAEESDSSKVVVRETVIASIEGMGEIKEEHQYVMDRKDIKNIQDDRSIAYVSYTFPTTEGPKTITPNVRVDRSDTYYISLPFDTKKDETYRVWDNKIGTYYEMTKYSEKDEEEKEGLKLFNFEGKIEADVADAYLEVLEAQGYPTEITFDQLKASLKAKGLDVDAIVTALMPILKPEELAALQEATAKPIKLNYKESISGKTSIEPKTGSLVDLFEANDILSFEVDPTNLMGLYSLLQSHADNPKVKAILDQLQSKMGELGAAQKVQELDYHQTADSVREVAQEVKDSISKLNLVKVYIPWILLIVGAVVLIGGLLMGGGPAAPAEVEATKEEKAES
jgi:hypothetical protein